MHHLEVKRQMGQGDIAAVSELLEVAAHADGHAPLGEHQWLDLVEGGRTGFAGLVAWEPGHDHPVGYAQVTRGEGSWALEFVVDPHHRDSASTIGHDLVRAALEVVEAEGGGRVTLWVPKPDGDSDEVAARAGLRRSRDLYQMRRPLPVGEPYEVGVRPFEPGRDEHAWLEVNNRAFAAHPEQGGWDLDTLKRREAEAWFDPDGFLLHEQGGRLAGFCWTKVHTDHHGDPALGEIYVVAVDPDFQGRGLGRRLVLAGLDHLSSRGAPTGMLYVDASNAGAVHLYRDLDFTVDHVDRSYVGDVGPT
ncbi:MAG: mycothiol synthase [Actinomycetota bacterium]